MAGIPVLLGLRVYLGGVAGNGDRSHPSLCNNRAGNAYSCAHCVGRRCDLGGVKVMNGEDVAILN